jgi:polyphosphate glucokinase
MKLLVIDIGGTNAKVWNKDGDAIAKIPTGKSFMPEHLLTALDRVTDVSKYDKVSLGYPGKVVKGKLARDPWNLGPGWAAFDFAKQFGKPVRIMNDAAMQALGSYQGGRMLFIGLGTSVGSAVIADNVILSLELGSIPHTFGKTLEHLMARKGLERLGKSHWRAAVLDAIPRLQSAFSADYVVLGGGNSKKLAGRLPDEIWLGSNANAYHGGLRLWDCRDLETVQIFEPPPEMHEIEGEMRVVGN